MSIAGEERRERGKKSRIVNLEGSCPNGGGVHRQDGVRRGENDPERQEAEDKQGGFRRTKE